MTDLDLALDLARRYWPVCLGLSWWARATWQLWTRNRYLGEALERFGVVSSSRERALAERITERILNAFFKAPRPTLQSLANDTETPWSLTPSTGSFPKRAR